MLSYFLPPLRFFNDTGKFVKEIWGHLRTGMMGNTEKVLTNFYYLLIGFMI